ncbi:MAG: PD40 domain-containing protein [candidate division Zixibacteria bacterium]|nr:PD40 domain-containing protein [candidate division Zixibacteria bacterium]
MNRRVLSATLVLILCWSSLAIPDEFFGKNKVQYKSFNWTYIQSPNFDLYYYEGEYELAKFSVAVLESALVTIEDQLDYRLKGRVPVFLYNSPNDFQQTNVTPGLLPEGVGGFTESFKNRVVLPFNGSYEDLRHVLHHELTHAVTFDWFYGKAFGTLVSRQYLFHLPLWFAEGYAEYSSRLGWDYEADMVMRDAVIHGYLIPFERLGGYLAYKEGQAAVKYIAERYGEEKLHEILAKGKSTLSLGKAIKAAIGLSEKELFEQFSKYQKRIYWPELATRKEPGEIAKRLTNHEKDASYFNEKPAFSPEGDKLAIFSDRSDFTEIYLISAIDGKKINRLVKSARSGDLESLHSYVSGISWSPEGDRLAFVAKSRGFDAIFIYDIKKDKIIDKLRLKFNSIYSPAWGSDEKIAFTGVESNQADIYLVDVATATVARITNDRYEQKDIAFSPDGSRIAFASDQPVAAGDSGQFLYGTYNIFLMDIESGAIKAVTFQEGVCRWPQWSPDGSKLCFTSNINGINNLYVKELDTDKQPYPITNVLTGIKSPSWSRDGKKIAFSSFFKGGYDIYVLKDIRPVTDEGAPLAKTKFALGELRADYTGTILAEDENDSTSSEDIAVDSILEDSEEYDDYVFTPPSRETPPVPGEITADKLEEEEPEDDGRDTLYAPLPGGEYEVKKYKAKFTPDLVSGGISYDAFYGMRGQTLILFSDYLGNHQFFIFTDLVNSINQSNFLAIYLNSTHRIDFGVGLFYNKNHFIDPHNRLFSDRTYGLMASV